MAPGGTRPGIVPGTVPAGGMPGMGAPGAGMPGMGAMPAMPGVTNTNAAQKNAKSEEKPADATTTEDKPQEESGTADDNTP